MNAMQVYEHAEMLLSQWIPVSISEMEEKVIRYQQLGRLGKYVITEMRNTIHGIDSITSQTNDKTNTERNNVMNQLLHWIQLEHAFLERQQMKAFQNKYGFMPTDLVAKRKFGDECMLDFDGRLPINDVERDQANEGIDMYEMMMIHWKPTWN